MLNFINEFGFGNFHTNTPKRVTNGSILVVSTGLIWFYFVPFSFNGVYFLWFIFDLKRSVCLIFCAKRASEMIVPPKEF